MKFSRPGHTNTRPDFFFRIFGNLEAKREIPENCIHMSPNSRKWGIFGAFLRIPVLLNVMDIFEVQIYFCHKKEGFLCH